MGVNAWLGCVIPECQPAVVNICPTMRNPFSGGGSNSGSRDQARTAFTPKQMVEKAKIAKNLGNLTEASALYQRAIKSLGENHNEVWNFAVNNLGTLIFEKGQLSEAKKFYKLAAENGYAISMFNTGYLCERLNQPEEALSWYQKASAKGHAKAKKKYEILKLTVKPKNTSSSANTSTSSKPKARVKPPTRLIKTPRDAEIIAKEWMIYFGFTDAKVTRVGRDNGIDVISSQAIGQVKFKGVKTPRDDIKKLHSDMMMNSKRGVFFSLHGYAKPAIELADVLKIALFEFDYQGVPQPINASARYLLAH